MLHRINMTDIEDAEEKIKEWNERNGSPDKDILFIRRFKEKGFDPVSIVEILNIIDSVCNHCWDNLISCQCWNDE